jgi:C-5 cytosine-specific DNA methylase
MKPRLLDLFCGAGGAARGYQMAGFHVTGVDITPQPRYVGEAFILGEALEYVAVHGREYDVIHASPPCQAYSQVTAWRGCRSSHPDMIPAVQAALKGLCYVVENVQGARFILQASLMLCGTMFGLKAQSHRWFEMSTPLLALVSPCRHSVDDAIRDHGGKQRESVFRDAIGCDWMTAREAREAIPPVYTEFIGRQLRAVL